ncbi:hypothetical protein PMG11_11082 [Penicillium brasilianum]|uniref:Uncharacterized protein n=1 Tax=Penicillium brasilianum TaxID=104259 RepID=A0A0F7U4E3_PENBI|nr:hypothetical protein PMG11_11082 [Penicillium brasilianum]
MCLEYAANPTKRPTSNRGGYLRSNCQIFKQSPRLGLRPLHYGTLGQNNAEDNGATSKTRIVWWKMRQEDVAAGPGHDFVSDISARPRAFTTGNHKNAQMFRPFPARKTRVRSTLRIIFSPRDTSGPGSVSGTA